MSESNTKTPLLDSTGFGITTEELTYSTLFHNSIIETSSIQITSTTSKLTEKVTTLFALAPIIYGESTEVSKVLPRDSEQT